MKLRPKDRATLLQALRGEQHWGPGAGVTTQGSKGRASHLRRLARLGLLRETDDLAADSEEELELEFRLWVLTDAGRIEARLADIASYRIWLEKVDKKMKRTKTGVRGWRNRVRLAEAEGL